MFVKRPVYSVFYETMKDFKEFSARFAQSVCILTCENLGVKSSCTISSYSSVSASANLNIFAFSLTKNSFMESVLQRDSEVRLTLLSENQTSVAKYYTANRFNSGQFSIVRIAAAAIGTITGSITRSIPVGNSILYLAKVQNLVLTQLDVRPLVYRLRNYEQ